MYHSVNIFSAFDPLVISGIVRVTNEPLYGRQYARIAIHLAPRNNSAEAISRFREWNAWRSAEINSRQDFALPDLFLSSSSLFCLSVLWCLFSPPTLVSFSIVYRLTNRRGGWRLAHWHAVSHDRGRGTVHRSSQTAGDWCEWMWNLCDFDEDLHHVEGILRSMHIAAELTTHATTGESFMVPLWPLKSFISYLVTVGPIVSFYGPWSSSSNFAQICQEQPGCELSYFVTFSKFYTNQAYS